MTDFPPVSSCPKCGSASIMTIDMADPAMLFECVNCRTRFHRLGFTPTEVETSVGLSGIERQRYESLTNR